MVSYTPSSEDVRLYECAVLYPYPINQKEESDLQKGVEEIFEEAKAKLILKDAWGQRGLAYNVGGFREGNFVIYYYELDPSKLKEIDEQLRILKGVLRHMIVKPPKNYVIGPMADAFDKWKEKSKIEEETRAQEKEEKLRKTVVEKAKRSSKAADKKAEEDGSAKKPVTDAVITEQLEKLISDKDLEL